MSSTTAQPAFVVVGHPNKGKSSVVATLAQNDAITVSPLSGTTTRAVTYPLAVDGEVLYRLIDTPGFQRPRAVMEWLQKESRSVADRRDAVARFLTKTAGEPRFEAEHELLTPILEGGGILYVVDGSVPFGEEYVPEMEILRWTGQPSMALVNPIGEVDHLEEWRSALAQYFRIVRVFNAATADHDRRLQLLSGFGELNEDWRPALERAVQVLDAQRDQRRRQASGVIAAMIASMVTHSIVTSLREGDPEPDTVQINATFLDELVSMELAARSEVETLYGYHDLDRTEAELNFGMEALFSQETWRVFGLDRDQLLVTGILGGAATGGVIDAATGGASLLLGSGIGALAGGATAWFGRKQLARTRIGNNELGRREWVTGPLANPNFPYVLLDRALLHLHMVEARTHARRDRLKIEPGQGASRQLELGQRRELEKLFSRVRRAGREDPRHSTALADAIYPLLGN